MDRNDCAVLRYGIDLDLHDMDVAASLQFRENACQYTLSSPAIHMYAGGMPVAESLGQAALFVAVFGSVKAHFDHGHTLVLALLRQSCGNQLR